MRFVIVGAGRVGLRTARVLDTEGHDVVVVEYDEIKAKRARNEGFEVIEGDGSREEVLERADLESADAIAGLTGDLNANFAACMLGKHHGCRTVLRIDDDYQQNIYEKFAEDVDEIIYPERLGAAGAKTALLGGDFNVVTDLTEGLQLTTMTVTEGSPVVGERVTGIELPEGARIYAHGAAHERLTIPLPQTTANVGDTLALVLRSDAGPQVRERLLGTAE